MGVKNFKLINGEIIEFRNKLNNEHLSYNINLLNNDMYEIYSIINNGSKITIGDDIDNGIVSDFFISNENELYMRYNIVLKDLTGVELKKRCLKLI